MTIAKTDILEDALALMKVNCDETFADVIEEFQKLLVKIENQLNHMETRVDLSDYEDFAEYVHALSDEVDTLKELSDAGYKVGTRKKEKKIAMYKL